MTWGKVLGETVLFSDVSPRVLDVVAQRAIHRRYRSGEIVFVQGDRGTRCYVIASGTVRIARFAPDGRETILAVLGAGDVFGELSLFDEAPRSADATAIEDTELLSFDARDLNHALTTEPELGIALVRILGRRLRHTNEVVEEVALFDVPDRLANRLAELAAAHGVPTPAGTLIDVPMSQESLARMVGATRESVNKALASLARLGLVSREGRRYVVPDVERLRTRPP